MEYFIAGLLILIVIFLIFREFFCWYWKLNGIVSILERIDERMDEFLSQVAANHPAPPPSSHTPVPQPFLPVNIGLKELFFRRFENSLFFVFFLPAQQRSGYRGWPMKRMPANNGATVNHWPVYGWLPAVRVPTFMGTAKPVE